MAMEGRGKLYVVALPFIAHSHFNAFLHLSRMLATRDVTIIYVSLPSNLQILRPQLQEWKLDLPIHFQDLSVPDSPLPPGSQNVNNISRDMMPLIFGLIQKMQEPLEALMAELTGREYYESRGLPPPDRVVLIYDMFMGFSAAVAAKFGVRSFMFLQMSAQLWLCAEAQCWDQQEPLPTAAGMMSKLQSTPDSLLTLVYKDMELTWRLADGILLNTFAELEPKSVQHLESFGAGGRNGAGKSFWAVGPVIDISGGNNKIRRPRDTEIVEWLDRQTPGSVVYVSIGSELSLSPAQVTELALGLEASGQPFVWVLRPPHSKLDVDVDSTSMAAEWKAAVLPDGYERRLGTRCIIECFWAPQVTILGHQATGAFITHCGWNSALESVAAGVPMIALPLQTDGPANALILEEAKVAVEINMSDGFAKKEEVERAVRRLMAADEAAEELKRRVKVVSKAATAAISDEGGAAWKSLDAFIQYSS